MKTQAAKSIFSELKGVTSSTTWPGGEICECRVDEENKIETPYGTLIPRYSQPDMRSKELKTLSFHKNGQVASIYLEKQTLVPTPAGSIPAGSIPAELITFYEDGSLNSLFPLNGQIGFGWSEEDEGNMASFQNFEFPFGSFTVKLNGIRFYPSGKIKSIIFWPGEIINLTTPAGTFPARIGIRLHEDGRLLSFEPAQPIELETPIGQVLAYDVNALGADADFNSVEFDGSGNLAGFVSSGDLIVNHPSRGRQRISSRTRLGLSDDVLVKIPLIFQFSGDILSVSDGKETAEYNMKECKFLLLPDIDTGAGLGCNGHCGSKGELCGACG
ncbi:hypothetical protein [Treponema primitia]|uniref:hypothetical protein n=1 Tax=Treponema primitia TaxID=88058 RepID=UPI0002554DBC|nr:hypothetical protein [Treponema primitia]